MVLETVVLWLHIVSAVGWLGAAMVFAMVVAPALATVSPQTRLEFFEKVVPRYVRYVVVFSLATLLFGVATVLVIVNGDYSMMSMSTSFGLYVSTGALLALVAAALGLGVVSPTALKMSRLAKSLVANPGPPPPEFMALGKRLRLASTSAMLVLVLVVLLMVAAATL